MGTPHKQPISFCSATSKILSFELISNNLASIVQIKATMIGKGILCHVTPNQMNSGSTCVLSWFKLLSKTR